MSRKKPRTRIHSQTTPRLIVYADVEQEGARGIRRIVVPSTDPQVVNALIECKMRRYRSFRVVRQWVCSITLKTGETLELRSSPLACSGQHHYGNFDHPDDEPGLRDLLRDIEMNNLPLVNDERAKR